MPREEESIHVVSLEGKSRDILVEIEPGPDIKNTVPLE